MQRSKPTKGHFIVLARDGDIKTVAGFLKQKVDVNGGDEDEMTALHWLVQNAWDSKRGRKLEVMKLLLDAGANVNKRDGARRTALHFAACHSDPEPVKTLVPRVADLNAE